MGRLAEAQAAYEQALAINPDHAEAHNNLGVVLKAQGRLDAAAEAYRRAIVLKPTHAEAQNNLGLVLMDQGRLDEAIRCFERALQILPGYGTALYNLGIAAIWHEDIPRALRCFADTARIKHDHGRPVTDSAVFRSRLKHDAEQLQYLIESGLVGHEWRPYYEALTSRAGECGVVAHRHDRALKPCDVGACRSSAHRERHSTDCCMLRPARPLQKAP